MNTLPTELLFLVAFFLEEWRDLFHLTHTCRKLYRVGSHDRCWNRLFAYYFPELSRGVWQPTNNDAVKHSMKYIFVKAYLCVLDNVTRNAFLFRFSSAVCNDRKIVLTAVNQEGHVLSNASDTLRNDKGVVLKAVTSCGWALKYASDALKNDKKVVLTAVTKYGWVFQYASAALRSDKEFVLAVVALNGCALEWVSDTLRSDKEIARTAVEQDEFAIQYTSSALRKNHVFRLSCRLARLFGDK